LSRRCGVSVALFVFFAVSLSSFLPQRPPTASEQRPHAAASHLPPIPILITIELAITLAVSVIIAVAVAAAVAITVAATDPRQGRIHVKLAALIARSRRAPGLIQHRIPQPCCAGDVDLIHFCAGARVDVPGQPGCHLHLLPGRRRRSLGIGVLIAETPQWHALLRPPPPPTPASSCPSPSP
jgi:hypothetical protein